MTFHFSTALTRLGTKFTGAGDSVSIEEAISTLDRVRRAAVTAKEEELKKSKPPLLFTDSVNPSDLFLYANTRDSNFVKGDKKLNVKNLHVVGGAIYESKRCTFPVSILYSERSNAVIINSCGTPFAELELEFYDYAFDKDKTWLKLVMDASSIEEHSQWHKEACTARKAGIHNTPHFLLGAESYTMVRNGVTPFMCLRAPENSSEYGLVVAAVQSDLRVFPHGSKEMMLNANKTRRVMLGFQGRTSAEMEVPREVTPPSTKERYEKATELVSHAVLTFAANIVLKNAVDDGFDEQDQPYAEYSTGIVHRSSHDAVMREVEAEEASFVMASKDNKVAGLASIRSFEFTISTVFKNTERVYATKAVCENSDAMTVMSAVAREIFHESDAKFVENKCAPLVSESMTTNTAISVLGKCLDDPFALIVITRDNDGRISNAKLIANDLVITSINIDALTRLATYTWTQFVIIDKEKVSVLLTRDPEYVFNAVSFEREKFRLRDSSKREGSSRPSSNMEETRPKIEELVAQVQALKSANEATLAAVNEFKRKLDFIVEMKAEADDPPAARPLPQTESSSILGDIKETFAKLVRFEKRARYS